MKHRYIDGLIIYIEIAFLKPFLFFLLLFFFTAIALSWNCRVSWDGRRISIYRRFETSRRCADTKICPLKFWDLIVFSIVRPTYIVIVFFSYAIDCGLVAHRTCTATGLPSNCIPVDSENRSHRFTPGKCTESVIARTLCTTHAHACASFQFRNVTLVRLGRNTPITSSLR